MQEEAQKIAAWIAKNNRQMREEVEADLAAALLAKRKHGEEIGLDMHIERLVDSLERMK